MLLAGFEIVSREYVFRLPPEAIALDVFADGDGADLDLVHAGSPANTADGSGVTGAGPGEHCGVLNGKGIRSTASGKQQNARDGWAIAGVNVGFGIYFPVVSLAQLWLCTRPSS